MSDSQRLESILVELRQNMSQLANNIGLKNNVKLSYINTGRNGFSADMAKLICDKYNQFNYYWILKGEGEMLKNSEGATAVATINYDGKGAPYYDVDFIGGFDLVGNDQTVIPTYYINYKPYNKATCWVNVTGNSMDPSICSGDVVALKQMSEWRDFLLLGEIYAIVTDDFRTIKLITKSDNDDCYRLVPINKAAEYHEQDIPKRLIRDVFQVLGAIKKF